VYLTIDNDVPVGADVPFGVSEGLCCEIAEHCGCALLPARRVLWRALSHMGYDRGFRNGKSWESPTDALSGIDWEFLRLSLLCE
jgi:hypothetical protein